MRHTHIITALGPMMVHVIVPEIGREYIAAMSPK